MNDDLGSDEAMKNLDRLTDKLFQVSEDETEDITEEEPEADE